MKKTKILLVLVVLIILSTIMLTGCTLTINNSTINTENTTASENTNVNENKNNSDNDIKDILGGWESSDIGGSYYVFKNDYTYCWYKSSDNLTDNYYKGNMEVLRGVDALDYLGISYEKVINMITLSSGTVLTNDIYAINLSPTYLISGGIDKTSTITDAFNMKMLFIHIDDNTAQAHNYTTGDTYYFNKLDK